MKPKQEFVLWKSSDRYRLIIIFIIGLFILNLFFGFLSIRLFGLLLLGGLLILNIVLDSMNYFPKSNKWETKTIFTIWKIKIKSRTIYLIVPILILSSNKLTLFFIENGHHVFKIICSLLIIFWFLILRKKEQKIILASADKAIGSYWAGMILTMIFGGFIFLLGILVESDLLAIIGSVVFILGIVVGRMLTLKIGREIVSWVKK